MIKEADVVGSTSQIINYVKEHQTHPNPFLILTECGITSRLQVENPNLNLVGSCMMCRYMKSNSLELILKALKNPLPSQVISIDLEDHRKALSCINQMFNYTLECH